MSLPNHDPLKREIEAVLATAALVPFSEQHAATESKVPADADADALTIREHIHQIALICERRSWPGLASIVVQATEDRVGVYGFTHINTHIQHQRDLLASSGDEGMALMLAGQIIVEASKG